MLSRDANGGVGEVVRGCCLGWELPQPPLTFGSGRASLPADVGLCPHCLRMYRAKHTPIACGAHGHPRSRLSRIGLGWRAGAGRLPRAPSPYTPLPACIAQWWMPHRAHPPRTVRIAVVSVALLLALPAPRTNVLRTSRHAPAPPPRHSAMLCGMKGEWAALSHTCFPTTACGQAYFGTGLDVKRGMWGMWGMVARRAVRLHGRHSGGRPRLRSSTDGGAARRAPACD